MLEALLKKLGLQSAKEKVVLAKGVNLTALVLSPEEGFLASRLENAISLEEILQSSPFPRDRTLVLMAQLADKGLLGIGVPSVKAAAPASTDFSEVFAVYEKLRTQKTPLHEILGISKNAGSKDRRKAFLEFSKKYHPDRLCRRNPPPEVLKWSEFIISRVNHELQRPEAGEKAPHDPHLKRSLMQFAQANDNSTKAKNFLREARKYLISDPATARESLRMALAFDPQNKEARLLMDSIDNEFSEKESQELFKKARVFEDALAYAEAAEMYEAAASGAPKNSLIQRSSGEFFLKKGGDPEKALDLLRKAVLLEPKNAENHRLLGDTLKVLKRDVEAQKVLLTALNLDKGGGSAKKN